jgi:hypothetical protein
MTDLILGVVDVPYENEGATPKKKPKRGEGSSRGAPMTTVSVATILEEKYGVMQAFYDSHKDSVIGSLINSAEGALETLFMGGPVTDPFADASQSIQAEFRTFLMTAEIEGMGIPGVPTKAAQDRRSLRFKAKVGPNQRPSFIDTGTYELSMRAWIEQ